MNIPVFIRPNDLAWPRRDVVLAQEAGPNVNGILRTAYIALAAFFLLFMIWAFFAPLNSAAIAQGALRADGGGRKIVQHLEGGIVDRILVNEGQRVRAGQPLVLLDETQSDAQGSSLQTSLDTMLAQDARLTAERDRRSSITYPAALLARADNDDVRAIIASSDALFASRRRAMSAQLAILNERLGQGSAEIASSSAQATALSAQDKLLGEEAVGVGTLVTEGLERKSRLLALQRQQAATTGQYGQMIGNMARSRESMNETRAQMAFLQQQQATDAAVQQREVQASLAETTQKLNVSRDVSRRRIVIAPVAGTVVNLRMVTRGGVVGAGQPILDIVPINEKIVIIARLKANDVDVVHPNLEAEIRLTPYKARTMPMLHGRVREVGADAVFDETTNTLYYEAQIVLDPAELKRYGVRLVSGMPAEVFINLGSRSLFQYLMQPFIDSFQRAFREE